MLSRLSLREVLFDPPVACIPVVWDFSDGANVILAVLYHFWAFHVGQIKEINYNQPVLLARKKDIDNYHIISRCSHR
jgi:hypothetical protein